MSDCTVVINVCMASYRCVCVLNQACREGELTQKLQEEQFCLLQCAVVEAEGIILDAVAKLDDPIHVCCISSPGNNPLVTSFNYHLVYKVPERQTASNTKKKKLRFCLLRIASCTHVRCPDVK